jgi:hypothetical protein
VSFEITTAFVQQYSANVRMLSQQRASRLRPAVMVEAGVTGKNWFMDQIGTVAAQRITDRHGDSPLNQTPHRRRKVSLLDYETGDLIDQLDKVKMLADPTSTYAQAHAAAMGRAMDDAIIGAAFDTAYTGEDGATQVAFPAGNQVAVDSHAYGSGSGNAGLTISKLIEAKQKLDAAEAGVDPDEERFVACTSKQIADLLKTTETTSADYNNVKALVEGKVDRFMGFNFIRTERLVKNASNHRRVMAWVKSGVGLCIGQDVTARITERADKRFSTYAYFCMSIGAARLEEAKVVEIVCAEA